LGWLSEWMRTGARQDVKASFLTVERRGTRIAAAVCYSFRSPTGTIVQPEVEQGKHCVVDLVRVQLHGSTCVGAV